MNSENKFLVNSKFTHTYGFQKTPEGNSDVLLEWAVKDADLF